jgi:hypothetical protein
MPVLAVALVLLVLAPEALASAPRWRPPLEPLSVERAFRFDRRVPFAAGQRRGVLLAGRPGVAVRAPCSGTVRFVGRVPRLGIGVALRCDGWTATLFGVTAPVVRAGAPVPRGAALGPLGPAGTLWLAARRHDRRHGYADPLGLLERDREPLGPVPRPRPARGPVPPAGPRRPAAAGVRQPAAPVPALAWSGVLVAGVALGAGTAIGGRGRARRPTSVGPACRARRSTSPRRSTT